MTIQRRLQHRHEVTHARAWGTRSVGLCVAGEPVVAPGIEREREVLDDATSIHTKVKRG